MTAISFNPIVVVHGQVGSSGKDTGVAPEQGKSDQHQTLHPDAAERKQLAALKQRDREVRAHEQAHLAAAGRYAVGGASFTYQRGPDGRQYAVGGEVNIDVSPIPGDPQATIDKMQQIQRAALAPAQPSSQDRAIAAQAARQAAEARLELAEERQTDSAFGTSKDNADGLRERLAASSTGARPLGQNLDVHA